MKCETHWQNAWAEMPKFQVRLNARAKLAIAEQLPEKFALSVLEYIAGPLADNPKRVGKKLGAPFSDKYSARVATYRIIYEIREQEVLVIVVDVRHRAHVYAAAGKPN